MTVVVIGVTGAVGCLLVPHWWRTAASVLLQYRRAAPPWSFGQCLQWDPGAGAEALERWAAAHARPSSMVVLAGATMRSGRDLSLNRAIAEACLAAARNLGIPRVIVASSSAVYGDHLDRPFVEEDEPRPVNAYGSAKLDMELACERWAATDFEVSRLRIGNVAGADAVLSQFGALVHEKICIDRFQDGTTPLRSYIGPGTLADILLELARYPGRLPGILNVGAPEPVQMGALADAAGLRWQPRQKEGTRGGRITLDCDRLWSLLPCRPRASDPCEMIRQIACSRNTT